MQSLQESIGLVIELQAKNLKDISEGKTPENPIEPKTWADVLKTMDLMPKFMIYEAIVSGEYEPGKKATESIDTASPEKAPVETGNAFEERSKIIKAKINGETTIGPKKN